MTWGPCYLMLTQGWKRFFFDEKRINLNLLNKPKNTLKTILTKGESTAQSFRGEGKREGGG